MQQDLDKVLLLAGLGVVIVPKAKLLRTSARTREVLEGRTEFGEYRSLLGMLEHLRSVNCAAASSSRKGRRAPREPRSWGG